MGAVTQTVPPELRAPWWAYAICLVASQLLLLAILGYGSRGHWAKAGIMALLASYGLITLTRYGLDGRPLVHIFSPRLQSWAMLADVFLAALIALASYAWGYYLAPGKWYTGGWWLAATEVVAYAAGLGTYWLEHIHYRAAPALLYSPAKLGHDLVTYPVLVGAVLYLAVPVLLTPRLWLEPPFIPWLLLVLFAPLGDRRPARSARTRHSCPARPLQLADLPTSLKYKAGSGRPMGGPGPVFGS